jgi:hypothetical protein
MAITSQEGLKIDLASSRFSLFSSQVSHDETTIEACQDGASAQDPSEKIMTP